MRVFSRAAASTQAAAPQNPDYLATYSTSTAIWESIQRASLSRPSSVRPLAQMMSRRARRSGVCWTTTLWRFWMRDTLLWRMEAGATRCGSLKSTAELASSIDISCALCMADLCCCGVLG